MSMTDKVWDIRVLVDTEIVWRAEVPLHRMGKREVETFLQRAVSRALTYDEILLRSLNKRKGRPERCSNLDVREFGGTSEKPNVPYSMTCGHEPLAVASVKSI